VFAFSGPHWLIHRWWTNDLTNDNSNGWSDWEILSIADFAGDPAAVSWGSGRIDVFVHGSDDDHLYDKVYDADHGGWHNWLDLGGTLLYSPAAASWGPGRIDVFAIGTDQQMWTKVYSDGQWSGGPTYTGWWPLGGYFTSSPAAGSLGPGHLDLAGRGYDGQVYHSWWGGQWSPWVPLGGMLTSAPAVVDSWQ
jgi:hypothetical protein